MRKRLPCVILYVVALILEILPYGAVLKFAEVGVKTYSYFNPITYGYANFSPLITAVLTVALLLMSLLLPLGKTRKALFITRILSAAATVISIMPIFFGFDYINFVGACISILLAAASVTVFIQYRK